MESGNRVMWVCLLLLLITILTQYQFKLTSTIILYQTITDFLNFQMIISVWLTTACIYFINKKKIIITKCSSKRTHQSDSRRRRHHRYSYIINFWRVSGQRVVGHQIRINWLTDWQSTISFSKCIVSTICNENNC